MMKCWILDVWRSFERYFLTENEAPTLITSYDSRVGVKDRTLSLSESLFVSLIFVCEKSNASFDAFVFYSSIIQHN